MDSRCRAILGEVKNRERRDIQSQTERYKVIDIDSTLTFLDFRKRRYVDRTTNPRQPLRQTLQRKALTTAKNCELPGNPAAGRPQRADALGLIRLGTQAPTVGNRLGPVVGLPRVLNLCKRHRGQWSQIDCCPRGTAHGQQNRERRDAQSLAQGHKVIDIDSTLTFLDFRKRRYVDRTTNRRQPLRQTLQRKALTIAEGCELSGDSPPSRSQPSEHRSHLAIISCSRKSKNLVQLDVQDPCCHAMKSEGSRPISLHKADGPRGNGSRPSSTPGIRRRDDLAYYTARSRPAHRVRATPGSSVGPYPRDLHRFRNHRSFLRSRRGSRNWGTCHGSASGGLVGGRRRRFRRAWVRRCGGLDGRFSLESPT